MRYIYVITYYISRKNVVKPCLEQLTLFGMTYVIYDIGFNKGIFLKKTLSRRNLN
jgi:hypothetical protein